MWTPHLRQRNRAIYCSQRCASWWFSREYYRKVVQVRREIETQKHYTCVECGKTGTSKRPRKFCSGECQRREAERRRPPRRDRTYEVSCNACGKRFTTKGGKYCSEQCRPKPPAAPKPTTCEIPWRECDWCGKWVVGRNGKRFCSQFCADTNHPYKSKVSPISYGDCSECGSCFVRRQGKVGQFCSIQCQRRAHKRDRKHKMRSTATAVGSDRITILALAQRDDWTCHLCGKKTDRKRGNGPNAPSIDHLVPVSAGGPHTWDNVALAHRQCNSVRGVGGFVQLRLTA